MSIMELDRQQDRFGSGRFATRDEMRRAGLLAGRGLHIGYSGRDRISLDGDSPGIVFAGAGAGKCRDWLAETIMRSGSSPFLIFDPKGELAAITLLSFIRWRAFVYLWNPAGLHGLPRDGLNPLDILTLTSPNFHSDCLDIASSLIPLGGNSNNGHYFERRAREWIKAFLISLVEQHGQVTFPMLWRVIQSIHGDASQWAAQLGAMDKSRFSGVRDASVEIWTKQRNSTGNEFGAIVGTIKAHLSFLDNPMLLASLDHASLSLRDLTSEQLTSLFVMVPRDCIALWSPVLRVIFTVMMKYKARAPQARRVTMLIDEAGQMGHFQALKEAFDIGRGEGVRTIALFQSISQIEINFERAAVQGFIGSAQWRCFFGVRDYDTARLISSMLGDITLDYDDRLKQAEAERQRREAFARFMAGDAPERAALDYLHHDQAAHSPSKMWRALLSPDEILAMPEDRQISFLSGLNLPPIYASKYPYWTTRALNGLWLPNPYHTPLDYVRLPGLFGSKQHRVLTRDVPAELAHLPQYRQGAICYVEGYRPW